VQISVYADRLMIWNPGQLPPSWTVEKLKRKHASHPFNPDLANVFFRAGEIEAWGRGIERMYAACRAAGFPEPVITSDESGLWISFAFSSSYRNLIEGVGTRADRVAPEVAPEVTPEVTPEVRLLRAMTATLTRRALQDALGLSDDEHFRQTYLLPALESGLIEMTIPDKPTSRLQRYRLTEAGRRRLRTASSGRKPR
jgi:ATP-dependent DNA helicase RecG